MLIRLGKSIITNITLSSNGKKKEYEVLLVTNSSIKERCQSFLILISLVGNEVSLNAVVVYQLSGFFFLGFNNRSVSRLVIGFWSIVWTQR